MIGSRILDLVDDAPYPIGSGRNDPQIRSDGGSDRCGGTLYCRFALRTLSLLVGLAR